MAVLLGGAVSASALQAMSDGVNGHKEILQSIFSPSQRKQCAVLTELIIPTTDTPGAIEAGVPHFVELMVSDWYTEREQDIFLAGLTSVDNYCRLTFKKEFLQCEPGQQVRALEHTQTESEAYKPRADSAENGLQKQEDEETPFFHKIRELTVLGYYTSEVGAKQELCYLPMPMRYGDIDLAEVGRQWSS